LSSDVELINFFCVVKLIKKGYGVLSQVVDPNFELVTLIFSKPLVIVKNQKLTTKVKSYN